MWFAHARPRELAPLYRFFGTRELAFGAEDSGLALARADAQRAVPGADARLVATVEPLAEAERSALPRAGAFAQAVAARVEQLLPDASVEAVARALRVSPRTLQRQLGHEQARFSEVLDGVRETLARRLVADPSRSIPEIAERLGFADAATFGRAFKRWTGRAPGAFRRA